MATPPLPAEQRALEQQYADLTRPTWSLTVGGGLGQGAAQQWRQQAGLVGAPTLGQSQLTSLSRDYAQQAEQARRAQQAQSGLAF